MFEIKTKATRDLPVNVVQVQLVGSHEFGMTFEATGFSVKTWTVGEGEGAQTLTKRNSVPILSQRINLVGETWDKWKKSTKSDKDFIGGLCLNEMGLKKG